MADHSSFDTIILGGGAAGIFAAIQCATLHPTHTILVLEKSSKLLSKVRISGGGRCNVTHACFDPRKLAEHYPRGHKALIGPFNRFQPKDTIAWFKEHGVQLKRESDGRMFPTTDNSETIIDCLLGAAKTKGVEIRTGQKIKSLTKDDLFHIHFDDNSSLEAEHLILATGSNPTGLKLAESLGHTIVEPVPSLFTLNIPTSPLLDLAGITIPQVEITLANSKKSQSGPLLLTHWGFSGPAALKLSAWEARTLHKLDYKTPVYINWVPNLKRHQIEEKLLTLKTNNLGQSLGRHNIFDLPKNLWKRLIELANIDPTSLLTQVSNKSLQYFAEKLNKDSYNVEGKTTYKSEFVTCGGIKLSEVNFKTMESRLCPKLFFAGEVLDIDGITGGFNFQNAWTTSWIAGGLGLE